MKIYWQASPEYFLDMTLSYKDYFADPEFKESSGCTAVAALVTHDGKCYVVCAILQIIFRILLISSLGQCRRLAVRHECQG